MIGKLFLLLLAFILAWFFGPSLSEFTRKLVVSVPAKTDASAALWEHVKSKSEGDLFAIAIWTVLLFLGLPVLARMLRILSPQARRYATTKFVRRIQGVTTELVVLGTIFFVPTALLLGNVFVKWKPREAHEIAMAALAKSAGGKIPTLEELKRDEEKSKQNKAERLRENQDKFTDYLDRLKSNSIPIRKEHYNLSEDFSDEFQIMLSGRNRANALKALGDGFKEYINMPENEVYKYYRMVDHAWKMPPLIDFTPEEFVKAFGPQGDFYKVKYAEAMETFSSRTRLDRWVWLPIKHAWLVGLLVSSVWLFLSHVLFKAEISAIHQVIMRFFDEGRFGMGGSGRFAGMFEEWGLLSGYQEPGAMLSFVLSPFNQQGLGRRFGDWFAKKKRSPSVFKRTELYLGRSLYNPFLNIGLSSDQHMLTIAASRSGKGATAIIPNLLLWEGSAIVIDPKGTNAAVTAARRRAMGQKVHIVDPFGIIEGDEANRACFNPLGVLDPNSSTIREDIGVIADALVVPDVGTTERHWDDGARTVLSGLIAQLLSDTSVERPTLPMLRDLLALNNDAQLELWATMALNDGVGFAARDTASRIIRGLDTNEITGLLSNADKHSEWLSSPAIANTLGRSTFSFKDLKDQPTTIYLILPPQYLSVHNRFLRMFINMAILEMSKGGRSTVPVLMIMDEFLALGHMTEVERALGLMAGYNLILWPIVQDLARLKDLYKNSYNSFIANSRAVQVFGVSDPVTTEYISKTLGNSGPSALPAGKFSTSIPLRSPDEVAKDIERESNRQYILRAGKPPLVLEKVPYFAGALLGGHYPGLFDGKYSVDPDYNG